MTHHNFIVIEGNIGSGKTSLVKKLASEYNAKIILEEFEENPFLSTFLENQTTNNLAVELQFLMDRFHQLNNIANQNSLVFSDYFIEKSLIFSKANLNAYEKKLFDDYFNIMFERITKPDLLVYLSVNTERLLNNIKKRGRIYEQTISSDYLTKIHNSYINYFEKIDNQKVIVIETSTIDFVNDVNHYNDIKKIIKQDYPVGIHHLTLEPSKF